MNKRQKLDVVLIQTLCTYLSENYGDNYTYEGFNNQTIEILAFSKADFTERYTIIRIGINNAHHQIYIPNILTPPLLKYNRVGKKLVRKAFEIGLLYGYDVFVVQLTDSFRERLLRRGAITTNEYDTLQIVEFTNLIDDQN